MIYRIIFYKGKLIFLLFLSSFIITSAYSKKIIIGKERVGEIKLHMPFRKIINIIGEKKCELVNNHEIRRILKCKYGAGILKLCFVGPHWFYYAGKKPLYKDDLALSRISINDSFYKTKHGVGVGSEYLEVVKKYKSIKIYFKESGFGGIWIPSLGLEMSGNSYDSEKDKFIKNPELIFKKFPITNVRIVSSELGCELGD